MQSVYTVVKDNFLNEKRFVMKSKSKKDQKKMKKRPYKFDKLS